MAMLRYNTGKAPLSLIPTSFFEALFNIAYEQGQAVPTKLIWLVGEVLDFGAKKYHAHNWRDGGSWASVMNSGLRHIVKMIEGEENDPESGLSHAGHLGCNIAFLLEFVMTAVGDDDLYKVPEHAFMVGFEADAEPNLIHVLDALLSFRDGGNVDDLREAAWELARYVEFKDMTTPVPAAPLDHEPTFPDKPRRPTFSLPFSFPSFSQIKH